MAKCGHRSAAGQRRSVAVIDRNGECLRTSIGWKASRDGLGDRAGNADEARPTAPPGTACRRPRMPWLICMASRQPRSRSSIHRGVGDIEKPVRSRATMGLEIRIALCSRALRDSPAGRGCRTVYQPELASEWMQLASTGGREHGCRDRPRHRSKNGPRGCARRERFGRPARPQRVRLSGKRSDQRRADGVGHRLNSARACRDSWPVRSRNIAVDVGIGRADMAVASMARRSRARSTIAQHSRHAESPSPPPRRPLERRRGSPRRHRRRRHPSAPFDLAPASDMPDLEEPALRGRRAVDQRRRVLGQRRG